MPSGPYVKSLQGVANASGALAPPQRAIVLGVGLGWEDAPDVVLTGNGQTITGATRLLTSGANANGLIYRSDTGGATVGEPDGLGFFQVLDSGGGTAMRIDGVIALNQDTGIAGGLIVLGAISCGAALEFSPVSTPAAPSAGKKKLYLDVADGKLRTIDSASVVKVITET